MSTQLLIYERAVPLSSQRHKEWSVKTGADYAFARQVNSVPLVAVEFPHAAAEYSIVFAGKDEAMMPIAILGMRDNENLVPERSERLGRKIYPCLYPPLSIRFFK